MKIDLHCHSSFSKHDFWGSEAYGTPEQIVKKAMAEGFGGIAITDHDSVRGALEGLKYARKIRGFVLVPGTEISSSGGHMLALGIKEDVPPRLGVAETIERIHDLGGIAVAAHPYSGWPRKSSLGDQVMTNSFDAIEVLNGGLRVSANRRAYRAALELGTPCVAGSDSHHWKDIGLIYNIMECGSSVDSVLDAIRKGNVLVRGRPFGLYSRMRLVTKKIFHSLEKRV